MASLEALRDRLASALEAVDDRYAAALAKQLVDVIREIAEIKPPPGKDPVDGAKERRAARRSATVSDNTPAPVKRRARSGGAGGGSGSASGPVAGKRVGSGPGGKG